MIRKTIANILASLQPAFFLIAVALCARAGFTLGVDAASLPDPGPVLFTSNRTGNFEMFAMNPDGTGVRRLTQTTAKNSRGRWSPDGSKIYFIRNDEQVWVMDADGSNPRYLTPGKTLAVAPDGAKLVVSRSGGFSYPEYLYVYDVASGASRVLVQDFDDKNFNPDISPDGTSVIYTHTSGSWPVYYNLRWVDFSGSNMRPVTSYNDSNRSFPNAPRWAPDGSLIVFSNRSAGQNEFLETILPNGTGQRSYISSGHGPILSPVWSPDWQYLLSSLAGQIVKTDFPYTTSVALTDGRSSDYPTDWLKGSSSGSWTNEIAPVLTLQPLSQTVDLGANVTFHAAAEGDPAPVYQWQFNGADLSGQTDPTLNLIGVKADQGGQYTVRVSNSAGSATSHAAVLTLRSTLSLAESLNAPQLAWSSGGIGEWMTATASHDGQASAHSSLSEWGESWLETQVPGPGTLTFWWRIASASGQDATGNDFGMFEFSVIEGGQHTVHQLGGPACDWTQASFAIKDGVHTVRWVYWPDTDFSGQFVGWLDEVTFLSGSSDPRMDLPLRQANGAVQLLFRGVPGANWNILASSDLVTWSPIGSQLISESGTFTLEDLAAAGQPWRFYRAAAGAMPVIPPSPQNASATAGPASIQVNWASVSGATSYNLYWSTQSGAGVQGAQITNQVATTYQHAGLQPNLTYYYVITAVNEAGESLPCQEFSATLLAQQPSADPMITTEVVDNGGDAGWTYKFTGNSSAIAVGPDDSVHIVYSDNSNALLKYAKKTPGGEWVISSIDSLVDSSVAVSITIDRAGLPHLLYRYDPESLGSAVKYARLSDNQWKIETIATIKSGWYSYQAQIMITDDEQVHLLYSGSDLHHAVKTGNSWSKKTVAGLGIYPWRATHKDNDLYVSHGTYGIGERLAIFIYDKGSETWITRTFKPDLTCTEQTPLAVDSEGRINVVGWGRGDGLTWLRISQDLTVKGSVLDSSPNAGQACDMVMNQADVMHIAFSVYDYWGSKWLGAWYYRVHPDGTRKWYVIQKDGDYRARSIAGDSLGNYHVTYYDAVKGDLKYARIAYVQAP